MGGGVLGAQPRPLVLGLTAPTAPDLTAFGHLGDEPDHPDHRDGTGCNAGGKGQRCRFCGFGEFAACAGDGDGGTTLAVPPPSPPRLPPGAAVATAGAFFAPGLDKTLIGTLRAQLEAPVSFANAPLPAALFAPGRWHANSSATLSNCAARIKTGWTARRDLVGRCARKGTCTPSGCTRLVCDEAPARGAVGSVRVYVAYNGQAVSADLVGELMYFDNDLVSVSRQTPHAGPVRGGTRVELHGQGFYDAGDTVCMFCSANSAECSEANGLLRTIPATVISPTYATCDTSAADAAAVCPDSAQCREARVGISLSGQGNAIRTAPQASWYFVDVSRVYISSSHPAGGPLGGGTLLLFFGQRIRACDGKNCPDPPLCIFEFDVVAPGAPPPAPTLVPAAIEVVTYQNGGTAVVAASCRVPASNLASQALTGLTLAAARRRMRVTLAPLGHAQPEAMVDQFYFFEYYDDIFTRLMPIGGPRSGATLVSLVGSGFGGCVGRTACYASENSLRLADQVTIMWNRPLCVFRQPSAGEGFDAAAQIIGTAVAVVESANLVSCRTPYAPSFEGTVLDVGVELALNGLVAESTRTGAARSF